MPTWSRSRSIVLGAPKPDNVISIGRLGTLTPSSSEISRWAIPRPTPDDAIAGTRQVLPSVAGGIGIRLVNGTPPLVHVARHVMNPVWADAFRIDADMHRALIHFVPICLLPTEGGSPRVRPTVDSARSLLPFRLGRKALPSPATIRSSVVPSNLGHRMVRYSFDSSTRRRLPIKSHRIYESPLGLFHHLIFTENPAPPLLFAQRLIILRLNEPLE